jgi:ketosteroid isomerase-like protein
MEILQNLMGGTQFKDRTSEDFQKKMAEVFALDVEVHEPECLPHGGVHKGRDNWLQVRRTMMELWDQKIDVLDMWEVPESDVIINHYMLDWTAKSTGRNVRQLAVEVIHFRDGQISRVEFYAHDAKALLDSLTPN